MTEDTTHLIRHLRLEAISLAILMVALTYKSGEPLWLLAVLFPVFDVGMLGYMFNPKAGATTYNFFHNATMPTILIVIGLLADKPIVSVIGFAWTFHISVDRIFGFGLKFKSSFYRTHLGEIAAKGALPMLFTEQSLQPGEQAQQYSSFPRSRSGPKQ